MVFRSLEVSGFVGKWGECVMEAELHGTYSDGRFVWVVLKDRRCFNYNAHYWPALDTRPQALAAVKYSLHCDERAIRLPRLPDNEIDFFELLEGVYR